MNKMGGFNLKYRYEEDNSPLGVIGSFTYTEKSRTASSGDYNKNQYYGITAGPAYRINDWASIYGVVGVGYGKFQTTEYPTYKHDTSDYGFSYGAGLQFNPMENVALDFSYEQSRIRSVDVGTGLPVLVTASNHFGDIKIRLSGRIFVFKASGRKYRFRDGCNPPSVTGSW